jgi:hypothetical protein
MKNYFDIQRLKPNGTLILPLSMSKLHSDQSPIEIYKFLDFFSSKISEISIDVVFLYTNGLYFNTDENALDVRQKTNFQMIGHTRELRNMIIKNKKFIPQAFHYLPWDYVLLNATKYKELLDKLKVLKNSNEEFTKYIIADLGSREKTEANINFLLEEITVTYLMRQNLIEFPHTLSNSSGWRLLCYPGNYIYSDVYVYQNKLLPSKIKAEFSNSFYNIKEKLLYNFDTINLSNIIL